MQDDKGLKAFFQIPSLYSVFQSALGAKYARTWFIQECLRPRRHDKIIDIGCGPGDILDHLPSPQYIGIDISEAYIAEARRRYGARGLFLQGTTHTWQGDERLRDADLVMSTAMLHHLDDAEASHLLEFARENLTIGGRFVAIEACRLRHQNRVAQWILSKDRGRNIRQETEWRSLLQAHFAESSTHVVTGLIRIPYTHIILEGHKVLAAKV